MPAKIIFFTKYQRNGASSRLRSFQYVDLLAQEPGVKVKVQSLFSTTYISKLYAGTFIGFEALKGYLTRFFFLFTIFRYNVIVIEKELFPYLPAWFEWLFKICNLKYVVDYDDAIFHNYDRSSNKWIRLLLKNKIKQVMRYANVVIAGNPYLADYAARAQAKQICIIPTVIDSAKYTPKNEYAFADLPTIGWIGTPKTIYLFQQNLDRILQNYQQNFKILTIGGKLKLQNVPYEFITWDAATEVENIKKIDIGIMPLLDSDFEKGKCGYKLIQYMACGIPVIASAVGVNNDIVIPGYNGFLVTTASDWDKYITYFVQNPEQVKILGEQARQTVLQKYTIQIQYSKFKEALQL